MRFLCLHGLGTNSRIFETQTARIREQLGPTYEFVFLDGEVECDAAPGVSAIFPGPYLSWYPEIPSESELTAARDLVLEVLNEEGPFNGLMGFSQGAALAASITLKQSSQANPLIDCGVFICGTLPWMLLSELTPLSQKYPANCQANEVVVSGNGIQDLLALKEGFTPVESTGNGFDNDHSDAPRTQLGQACLLYPKNSSLRFPIPTAHIYGGRKDRYFALSKALVELGSEAHGVKVLDHGAGHLVPRGEIDTAKMVEIVTWISDKVLWRC